LSTFISYMAMTASESGVVAGSDREDVFVLH
jgi:hypothetical protein